MSPEVGQDFERQETELKEEKGDWGAGERGEIDEGRGDRGEAGLGELPKSAEALGEIAVTATEMQLPPEGPQYGDAMATRTEIDHHLVGTDLKGALKGDLTKDTLDRATEESIERNFHEHRDDPRKAYDGLRSQAQEYVFRKYGRVSGERNDGSGSEIDFIQEKAA